MGWTDDPVRDADRYFREQEEAMEDLPTCSNCYEKIIDDRALFFDDIILCPECIEKCIEYID